MLDDKNHPDMNETSNGKDHKIIMQPIEDEMKKAYLDYAMSVIVGRALPDVKDGLKPVHRRILFAMNEMGNTHNKAYKKCARIVGEVLGKFHPHGDTAVYDSLVRMAQNFSLRYPLVQGQGNFGSVDGDSAAAMRYCVTGDSLILTDKGLIRIDSISNKEEENINLNILSQDGKINKTSKFFNSGKHKIIKIETEQGYELKGTHNHPILCLIKNKNNKPILIWKLLEEIKEGDFAILQRNFSLFSEKATDLTQYKKIITKSGKQFKNVSLPNKMDSELAFLLGALVSEGSFHQKKIIFNNSDMRFYEKIKEIILNKFRGIKLYERNIKGNCKELEIYHQKAVEFLKNIGFIEAKSDKKSIPFSVLTSKKEHISWFLKGLFEGDGSVIFKTDKRHNGNSIELTYTSKSKQLINELKIILLNFGIPTTNPYKDKRNECYKIQISGFDAINIFQKEINFFSERKQNELKKIKILNQERMSKNDFIPFLSDYLRKKYKNTYLNKNNFDRYNLLTKNIDKISKIIDAEDLLLIHILIKNKYFFNKIIKIENLKEELVYSVKVESVCHSFTANGFINHNTEARLAKISDEMLQDIEKETVNFTPNFDRTLKEPVVLPAKIPGLLVNGSSGIAVGMATNIPPHNITEVCTAVSALIDNPQITDEEIMQIVTGPDFPTGAEIIGRKGIIDAYKTGKGSIKIRSIINIEKKKDREKLIISEIPYQVNKATLVEDIAGLVRDKKITEISDLRDESDKDGIRIVIELKKDANAEIVKNLLYNYSRLEDSFGINVVALVDNQPKLLPLKSCLHFYVLHRIDVTRKKCMFDLRKAEERAHILEGLKIALSNIDAVVALIKKSKSADEAKKGLIENYKLTEVQSQAILDMKLQRIAALEQEKILNEFIELMKLIKELKETLGSEIKIRDIIKKEMKEIIDKYGDKRKTTITDTGEDYEFEVEDLIVNEPVVITITHSGYIKRMPLQTYKVQNRGGKGVIASDLKEGDFVEDLFVAKTHSYLLMFSNKGKMYWLKVHQIPDASRQALGKAIVNLLELRQDEKLNAVIPVKEFDDKHYLVMATKLGTIKKTNLNEFSSLRKGGIIAINLDDEAKDELINVVLTDGSKEIILASKEGQAARFNEKDVRNTGRTSAGVRGIKLDEKDEVIGMIVAEKGKKILSLTENGYGKQTDISEYRLISRGGKGVRNIKCSERNGNVVAIACVSPNDDVMFISKKGILIRTTCGQISDVGRSTQGVRLMKLSPSDKAINMAKIAKEALNGNTNIENNVHK